MDIDQLFLTLNIIWRNIKYLKRIVVCGLSLFGFFPTENQVNNVKNDYRKPRLFATYIK